MFAGITKLTELNGLEVVSYSTEQSKLINNKNTQKNTEFEVAKTLIIDKFNAAIKSGNSDDLEALLNNNDYNGTNAVINDLTAIIKVNRNIKSMNAQLEILETKRNTKINSLSKDAENEKKKKELEAENAKLTKEIGELQFKKKSFEENNNNLNNDIRSSKALLELKKQKLQTQETTLNKLTEQIEQQNQEIAKLNVEILKHTANQNMLDIKIKHYQGLKETSNKAHDEQRSTLQKDIEELKKTIDEL